MPTPGPLQHDPIAQRIGTGADRIGPYRLVRPISAGGMARVYEGRFESLAGVSTRVAIKIIHPDFANEAGFQELFIQEARISARLEHLNLVRVQQFNREDDLYFLVMEYIDGVTFRKVVSSCRKYGIALPPPLLAEMARQVCDGLSYAHALVGESGQPLHLVHRDIKPSNLMLNTQGVAKLLDFGISYAHGSDEQRGSVKGTWGYMAPEQSTGEPVGPAADLFGLAAVLYEVASLEPLFPETDNAAVARLLVSDEAARRAAGLGGAYLDLSGVLVRALQRDPDARFRTADAMGKALGQLVPDPLSARDGLVRLVAELRRMDAGPSPVADTGAAVASSVSAASVSTMQPGRPGLPVVTGNAHAPRKPQRSARRPPPTSLLNTVLSLGFAAVALGVLLFTTWRLFFQPREVVELPPIGEPASMAGASASAAAPVGVGDPLSEAAGTPVPAFGVGGSAVPAGPAGVDPLSTVPEPAIVAPVPAESAAAPVVRASTSGSRPRPAAPVAPAPAAPVTAALVAGLATEAPAAKPAAVDARDGEGSLSLGSTPRAQVMIDGAYVRYTPIFQLNLAAGTHTVVLVTDDGRRKSFRVEIGEGKESRKVWMFDESRWADDEDLP